MPHLPQKYAYLREAPLPPVMVRVALDMLGTLETPGAADNPVILGWADEIARVCQRPYDRWAADFYNDDAIPWCGLFVAVVAARTCQGRAERMPPKRYLAALAWADWGTAVDPDAVEVGDIVVLQRDGGGHVFIALGVSADDRQIMGIGGNQGDAVTIAAFDRSRLKAVRRPPYQQKPAGSRRVVLASNDTLSIREV